MDDRGPPPPHPDADLNAGHELPAYEEPPRVFAPAPPASTHNRSAHAYTLLNRAERPWATLRLRSRAPSTAHLPYFFEGDEIAGTVELDLEREDTIQSVSVIVQGQLGSSSLDAVVFFKAEEVLWSTAIGDPRQESTADTARTTPSPTHGSSSEGSSSRSSPASSRPPSASFFPAASKFLRRASSGNTTPLHSGKLAGTYSWPFALTLPKSVTLPQKLAGAGQVAELPPSFSERSGVRVTVQYDLIVHVRRGKLRVDSKLGTIFGYTPLSNPVPASELRQLAYQEHLPSLIGPEGDPDGFERLQPAIIRGRIFNSRDIEATCEIYVARPLSYTRGTPVPLVLTVACADVQALDVLAQPAILSRALHVLRDVAHDPTGGTPMPAPRRTSVAVEFKNSTHFVASAVLWPSAEGAAPSPNTRRLDGEIVLPKDLKPTASLLNFSLRYTLALLPPVAPFFAPAAPESVPLLTREIAVTTAYARGARPRQMSPPGYELGEAQPAYADGLRVVSGRPGFS